jgi:hypothetical protein
MGFCQVGWAVRNGANPLKGVRSESLLSLPTPMTTMTGASAYSLPSTPGFFLSHWILEHTCRVAVKIYYIAVN